MREKDIKLFQDFYNKSSKEERFKMCLNKGEYHFTSNDVTVERESYDYNNLNELLKNSEFEPYVNLLIQYQNKLYDYIETESDMHNEFRNIIEGIRKEDKFTNLLIFLNEFKDTNWGLNITFTNVSGKKVEIRDNELTDYIFDAISFLYSDLEMNRTSLTIEEAKDSLTKPESIDDLKYHYSKCRLEQENIDLNNIPECVLQSFAEDVSKERDVDIDFLNIKREELDKYLEKLKPKPGRKIENSNLGELSLDLSYLIRFQSFVIQDEVEHIYDYEISNDDLKLIYKYLNFWDLKTLKSNVKNKDENADNELKAGYINVSSWIGKYKSKRGKKFSDIIPNLNEIEIDNYRKVVRGEIT